MVFVSPLIQLEVASNLPVSRNLNLFLANPWVATVLVLFFLFLSLWIIIHLLRRVLLKTSRLPSSLSQRLLMITVPKETLSKKGEARQETPELVREEIGVAENIFAVLGGLRAQRGLKHWFLGRTDHFAAEIILEQNKIYFYLAAPDYLKETVEQQIHAAYPHALVEEVEDYNIFSAQGAVVGTYLKFGRDFIFPLRTFRKMEGDPLNALTNALSRMSDGAEAGIQLVARSAHKKWHYKGVRVSREIQQGKSVSVALRRAGFGNIFDKLAGFIGGLLSFFAAKKKQDEQQLKVKEQQYRLSPMEQEVVKAIEEKTSKAGMDVNLRLVVSAQNKETALNHLNNLVNVFAQYNIYQYGNVVKRARRVRIPKLVSDFIHRSFESKFQLLFNTEEMASLWHLPLASSETPNINWLEARKAPPPLNLPAEGILLGENIYRGRKTPVRIKRDDRRRHAYIIGKSGTGKSVLLKNLVIQDIKNGEGVCLIDPHGDLVESVLEHIPPNRVEDVILFDPADLARPIGLNMLEFVNPEQKTFVINEMISIFDKLYDLKATGGPIFEQYMRNAMLLMMEDRDSGATLLEIPKVLADASFRRFKLSKCQNPVVKDFWEKEAEKAGGEAALANLVPYITSKLTPFVSSDLLRPIIAQQQSSFNLREVMDSKKILLIKLAKGQIGDMSANLLGMIMVGKLLIAALSRVDVPDEKRDDFYLYIDEFQNFITESIAIILSEARKYKLCLTMAHQYVGQLVKSNDTAIRDAVFGNVGTMIAFRIGPDDAELLAKQFAPVFNEYDLINIPKFNAYLKLLIDNQNPPAFNIVTAPPTFGDKSIAERIKKMSRLKYGRDRGQVEAEVLRRLNLKETAAPVNVAHAEPPENAA